MTMIERLRAQLDTLRAAHAVDVQARSALVATADARTTADFEGDESQRFDTLSTAITTRSAEITAAENRIKALESEESERSAADQARAAQGQQSAVTQVAEPDLYRERGGESFVADLYSAQTRGDWGAQERLRRFSMHQIETRSDAVDQVVNGRRGEDQKRAVATGNLGALVPPKYLLDLYAPLVRQGRVLANLPGNQIPLPDAGMSMLIPRGTAGTNTAVQATQNAALVTADIAVTDLTVPITTVGGGTEVSRQSLERGPEGLDRIVFTDLAEVYATQLNSRVMLSNGTGGDILGLISTPGVTAQTWTEAAPTGPKFMKQIAKLRTAIWTSRLRRPDVLVMTPARWEWLAQETDSTGRPLVVPSPYGPVNAFGSGTFTADEMGYTGFTIQGTPVVVDATIPINRGAGTNQDVVFLLCTRDLYLWEENGGSPRQLTFEQPKGNQLTVQFFVYAYAAFTAGRYASATGVLEGTGLIQPTFA